MNQLNAVVRSLSVEESVVLAASVSEVWGLLADFNGLANWIPAVAKSSIIQGTNNQEGAIRHLVLMNGGFVDEQLIGYDPVGHVIRYTMTGGGFPVSDYLSALSVVETDKPNQAKVVWRSQFNRKDMSAQPQKGSDDETAVGAVRGVYQMGLKSLKEKVEDMNAIKEVVGYYAEGGTRGQPEVVAKAFHPSAFMKFMKEGQMVDVPIADFFKNFIKPNVNQQREVFVDSIDVRGTAASVRLTIDYSTHQFIDYFNLLKVDGKWLIVNKIFHRIDK